MKIAFVSKFDAENLSLKSQHAFFVAKCLRDSGYTLEFISPLDINEPVRLWALRKIVRLTGKRILPEREPEVLDGLAVQVEKKLKQLSVDLIFSDSTLPISHLNTNLPVVFWADATFAGMLDFYRGFDQLTSRSIRNGNLAEQSALSKSAMAFYSSEWVRQTCINNYEVDASRIHSVLTGANLIEEPSPEEVKAMIAERSMEPCRLLFVGLDWQRKNGDAAVALTGELNRRGLPSKLTVIGDKPGRKFPPFVEFAGKVDKSLPADQKKLSSAYAGSHFLLLPSRAEALGRVLTEANAFGVPCIATNVGGISNYIKDGGNGHLFPSDEKFVPLAADFIIKTMSSRDAYVDLANHSHAIYCAVGNWRASGNQLRSYLSGL